MNETEDHLHVGETNIHIKFEETWIQKNMIIVFFLMLALIIFIITSLVYLLYKCHVWKENRKIFAESQVPAHLIGESETTRRL
jgi:hypothetical protein